MIVFELPCYKQFSGGITRTLELARRMRDKYDVHIRFQREEQKYDGDIPYSIGLPDATFPACDYCITYSDTPYSYEITGLVQVQRVFIYMLSYGMCIDRERKNVLNPGLKVMSSTLRTKNLIQADGRTCHNVGFGEISVGPIPKGLLRQNYAALMYHPMPDKGYELGVKVCNALYREKLISGVLTFGVDTWYNQATKPDGLVCHWANASAAEVLSIFSQSSVFIMPSITEGLNMTPIEATLCGCPAVICDGAIGEIYWDGINCEIAEKDNFQSLFEKAKNVLNYMVPEARTRSMKIALKNFTWEKTIANIERVMGI